MRFRFLAALAVTLLASGFASAQPKVAGPTFEVRIRSVNDLVDKFEYLAGLVGQENFAEQVRETVKSWSADGKGVEGIDPKQPFGAYAMLAKDIETSPFVVMIPIADEKQFLEALKTRFEIVAEKADDGTYKVPVPNIDEVHLRFLNGYLYVSQNAKTLDPKTLIKPKDFFAKDDGSVASLIFHIDRVPEELRTFALGQLELGIAEARKQNADTENANEKHFKNLVLDLFTGATKGVVEDGKELAAKIFVDPKTDIISAEVSFSAKNGSTTAKHISALGGRMSLPVGIVAAAGDPVAFGNVKLALPDNLKKDYNTAIDEFLKGVVKDAPGDQADAIKQLVAAVGPTLKAGELDAALGVTGPNDKGHYQLIGAFAVKEGKGIEKFLKEMEKQYGDLVADTFTVKFDVEKIGDFTLHRVDLKEIDEKFEKAFGTKSIWVAVSDTCIALSIEPEGTTIKKAVKAKPAKAPIAQVEVALSKLVQSVDPDLTPEELKKLLKETFGDGPVGEKDRVTFSITGGDKLTAKFQMKGKGIKVFAGLELFKMK